MVTASSRKAVRLPPCSPFPPSPSADPLCLPMFSPVFTPPYVHPLPSKFLSPPSLPSAVYCPLFTPGFSWVYPLPSIVPFCHTDLRLKSFFPFGSNSCGYSRCALHNLPYGHSYGYPRALPLPRPARLSLKAFSPTHLPTCCCLGASTRSLAIEK